MNEIGYMYKHPKSFFTLLLITDEALSLKFILTLFGSYFDDKRIRYLNSKQNSIKYSKTNLEKETFF